MARALQIAFGQAVRVMRVEAGLLQQDVADRAGVSQQQVSRIEAGDLNVTILTMCKLASALGGDVSTMIMPQQRGQVE